VTATRLTDRDGEREVLDRPVDAGAPMLNQWNAMKPRIQCVLTP
jgi:hypothetical protein